MASGHGARPQDRCLRWHDENPAEPSRLRRRADAYIDPRDGRLARLRGSNEVNDLFFRWVEIMPTGYGPEKNDEQDAVILAAANAVRDRMADEVQGRIMSL